MIRREISVLLRLAVEREEGDTPREFGTDADLALLASYGLTDQTTGVVTDKGEAYIRALEAVLLPVQQWVVPAPAPIAFACSIDESREGEEVEPASKRSKKRGNRS